jgi:dTDP-4-dehydrorhamnose reductase
VKVLIAGATGMLGATLAPCLEAAGHDVVRHGHLGAGDVACDLTDRQMARALVDKVSPQAVVNLVALTNVDLCEREPDRAYRLNVLTVENLVAAMAGRDGAFLVQISTDQVYDAAGPNAEENARLTNTYAMTKYAGELAAKLMPSAVLRTNFFGRSAAPGRNSFSDWVLDGLLTRKPMTAFTDVIFNPVSMITLSSMIGRVLERPVRGVFNVGSHGALSKADFIRETARLHGLSDAAVTRGLSTAAGLPAYRPKDMSMDCARFERAFGVALPRFQDEIAGLKRDCDGALQ